MILIAGAGGLGSRIAIEMYGQQLYVIDDDVVEANNIAPGMFMDHHVGASKALVVSELCARRGIAAEFRNETLTVRNVPEMVRGADLVVDCLDNAQSRALLSGISKPTLHVGVGIERTGLVLWDQVWFHPQPEFERGENLVCTHQAGALILQMTAAAAVSVINRWWNEGAVLNAVVTETSIRMY